MSWHSEFDHLDSLQEQGGINLYACVNGDPLGYVNLDGRNPVAAAIAATTAAAARALLKKLLRDIAKKKAKDAAKKQAKSSKSKAKSQGCVTKGGRGQQVGSMIKTDGSTTTSAIKAKAESVGFKSTKTANGPLKMVDENGVARVTIKGGSQHAPGSAGPHVELKTSSGQRVNPAGNQVTRKSPENHTPIDFDL
ncbi:RHS repeat-associated core domain-containing protein [Vibrio harveyi]|uniref:hypothetical protein n=1 Tax=Vibrio harveyi TaxID=669 RepID=UPI0023804CA1|nr:hypothetical protein [Vibrio harveyi]